VVDDIDRAVDHLEGYQKSAKKVEKAKKKNENYPV
jgi:hypothetical protein